MAGRHKKGQGKIGEKGVRADTGVSLAMPHLAPIAEQQDRASQEVIADLSSDGSSLPTLLYSKNPVICDKGIKAAVHNEATSLLYGKNPGICNKDNNAAVGNNEDIEAEVGKETYADDNEAKGICWTSVEGVEGLDGDAICHIKAFYSMLQRWYSEGEYTSILLLREDYDKQVKFLCFLKEAGDCQTSFVRGNANAYKWAWKYCIFTLGGEKSTVLVLCPTKIGAVDVRAMSLSHLQQPTYVERIFADLWKIYKEDHCKGMTFFNHVREKHGNVSRDLCKMFTDVCPHCITVLSRQKPTAGIKNIVTDGFGIQGQVDIIDFQSMPDRIFKYLLNYIDHGVKKLTSIPLAAKRATSVAVALLTIFTKQGPPSILQSDNGDNISNHAHDYVGRRMLLDNDFVDLVIKEL
jgi:hypothetical protein